MNKSQIELIVRISETGSFTKAGEELHMTQPAVSRTVATIESQLGTKLIERDKKNGLFFTDVGERVLVIFRKILSELQKVDELVAAEQGLEIGKVHIGAYRTACTRFIPKIIRAMENQYPGLEIKLSEGSVDQVKEWLRSKCIDVGIIIPPDKEFDTVPLIKDQLIVLMHSSHPLYQKETIGIPDLQGEDILIGKGGYEVQVHALFKEYNLTPKVRFEMDYIETGLSMIQEGLGITITTKKNIWSLPDQVVFRELKPDTFRDINI
ncbi:LysR family transcriptional regulator, partial [Priestia megaterium]